VISNNIGMRQPTPDEALLSTAAQALLDREIEGPHLQRIEAELHRSFLALAHLGISVSIFGSARTPETHPDYALARHTARMFGEHGFNVITGGGPGLMEAANRGAHEAGVESVGLSIELPFEQAANAYCTIPLQFYYFFIRKVMYVRYSSAFICLPGGVGTLDEFFEVATLAQTRKINHFPAILIGREYWQGLVDWLQAHPVASGKMDPLDSENIFLVDSAEEALGLVLASQDLQTAEAAEF
jgi:uncharacterized protein (TIGR00730 family)